MPAKKKHKLNWILCMVVHTTGCSMFFGRESAAEQQAIANLFAKLCLLSDIRFAIGKLKNDKSFPPDGIPAMFLQIDSFHALVAALDNSSCSVGEYPDVLRTT